jgi:hypothetical protein
VPWLADADIGAAHGLARTLGEARAVEQLRRQVLHGLAELVPADVLTWDSIELAGGAVRHEALPAEAEPPGAFAAVVRDATGHPLLCAHAARRRSALRLSEAADPRHLSHSHLYGDLLHRSGIEYAIAIAVRTERRTAVVAGLGRTQYEFSERDRDVLDLVRPGYSYPGRGFTWRCSCQSSPAATSASWTRCHAAPWGSSSRMRTRPCSSGIWASRPRCLPTAATSSSARAPGRVTWMTIALSGTRADRSRGPPWSRGIVIRPLRKLTAASTNA